MSGRPSGSNSARWIGTAIELRDLLAGNFVAPSPSAALDKIRRRYSCDLTVHGDDCAGIVQLRRLIASIDPEVRYARCLLITAPHTHWGERTIVESFDAARREYSIGSEAPRDSLVPYSFVFSAEDAIPYEWADHTVPVEGLELAEAWGFVQRLNSLVVAEFSGLPIPLGVTIDHRFKRSIFDRQIFSFAETPPTEKGAPSMVRALVESVVERNPTYPGKLQAAWFSTPRGDVLDELNEREIAALAELEKILARKSPEEALGFLAELESYLRSK
jgi:hypothetical protein